MLDSFNNAYSEKLLADQKTNLSISHLALSFFFHSGEIYLRVILFSYKFLSSIPSIVTSASLRYIVSNGLPTLLIF